MTTVTDFRFLTDLHMVRYRDVDYAAKRFYVQREFRISFLLDGQRHIYTVPAGTRSDGPSIPEAIPKWIADFWDGLEASVPHDRMCIDREKSGFTSKEAAEIFRAGMEAANVPAWRREIMYQAVLRLGPQWEL